MLGWPVHLPPGTGLDTVDSLAEASLPTTWTARWAADPDHPTVCDTDGTWWSADRLEHRSREVAARLAHAGVRLGDRLLLSAATSADVVAVHVAALRLGVVVVPANTASTEREIRHVVGDARPSIAVVDDDARARWVIDADPTGSIVVVDPEVSLPDGPDPAWLDGVGPSDGAVLAYTSGTTGTPKGALLTHGNLRASAEALRLAWRWTADDRLALPLPLFHLHGLGVGLHGTLGAGASVVLRPRFDPADTLDTVAEHHASLLFGVPTMWSRLAQSGRLGELRHLRLGVSGSAPLDPGLHAEVAATTGHALIERYGMTETVMLVSNPYDGERRAGTVGIPLPGVEVRLDDATDEIQVRGPNVFGGYWQQPDATTASFVDGPPGVGWFATGDVGAVDAAGYLRIVGRRKELIISGGYNVYPREVEDVLRTHPSIGDVAVVGLPHPDWGEEVVAAIEHGEPTDATAIHELAAESLAPYKRPKRLVFVEALPRNAMGKVMRDRLRDELT